MDAIDALHFMKWKLVPRGWEWYPLGDNLMILLINERYEVHIGHNDGTYMGFLFKRRPPGKPGRKTFIAGEENTSGEFDIIVKCLLSKLSELKEI